MPTYITLAKVRAALPEEITAQLLDDHGAGAPDSQVWSELAAAVAQEIDGKLGQRYSLPLSSVPDLVASTALVLAAELLYQRRGYFGEANPWSERAKAVRATLDAIASGDQPLTATATRKNTPGAAITEAAKTHPSEGGMLV